MPDPFGNLGGSSKPAEKRKPMNSKQKAAMKKQEGEKIKAVDGLFRKSTGIQ
ncbi:MAG: hypothetical protein GWP15_02650 [Nitrospirae bacterium]|nr:hypothetical protein [Nitrospirota bacterium]